MIVAFNSVPEPVRLPALFYTSEGKAIWILLLFPLLSFKVFVFLLQ